MVNLLINSIEIMKIFPREYQTVKCVLLLSVSDENAVLQSFENTVQSGFELTHKSGTVIR
jgi:hypothetical protein